VGALPNPVNDAEDVSKELQRFGFEVLLRKNIDRRAFVKALEEFGRKAQGAEIALFFFAGHGVQAHSENFLVPVNNSELNSEPAIRDGAVSLNRVLEEIEMGSPRLSLVLLDACRDNPITGKYRGLTRGLAQQQAPQDSTIIVYATGAGNVASDGAGRNGLFTSGLLNAFRQRELRLDAVLDATAEQVERISDGKQKPHAYGPVSARRKFYFAEPVTIENNVVINNPGLSEAKAVEIAFWDSVKNNKDPAMLQGYINKYPSGEFVDLAYTLIRSIQMTVAPSQLPRSRPELFSRYIDLAGIVRGSNAVAFRGDQSLAREIIASLPKPITLTAFKPAFYSDGLFSQALLGEISKINALGLAETLKSIYLFEVSPAKTITHSDLQGLTHAMVEVQLTIIDIAKGQISVSSTFNLEGKGFSPQRAQADLRLDIESKLQKYAKMKY